MMAEPKGITIGTERSGIKVEFIRRRQVLNLFGWYDHFVGIEGDEIPLGEFLAKLGIDLKMCRKALEK